MLRPLLTRFVRAFDGEPDIDFWSEFVIIILKDQDPGWITAFCVWSSNGKWRGPPLSQPSTMKMVPELVLDDVSYPDIEKSHVPVGFCEVDVKLDDNGQIF
jgi:hypothetical protein